MAEGNFLRHAQHAEAAPREDAGADRCVRLDLLELLDRELPQLQEDGVGDADLADVVQRGRAPDEQDLPVAQPEMPRQEGRHLPDALGVLPRLVVAELRRAGEPLDDLVLRRLEVARALPHLRLEDLVLALHLEVQEARLEQRADPQHHLVGVERLGDEVFRPAQERLLPRLRRQVARHHQHREEGALGNLAQAVEHLEAVHVRHVEVEQDQVGARVDVELHHLARVARALDPPEPLALEQAPQHEHVRRLVVDDQDARLLEHAMGCPHAASHRPQGIA